VNRLMQKDRGLVRREKFQGARLLFLNKPLTRDLFIQQKSRKIPNSVCSRTSLQLVTPVKLVPRIPITQFRACATTVRARRFPVHGSSEKHYYTCLDIRPSVMDSYKGRLYY